MEDIKMEQPKKVEPKKDAHKSFIERKLKAINKLQDAAKAKRLKDALLRK